MASDSAATYAAGGSPTIGQQNFTKIRDIAKAILYSSTGAIGIAQVYENVISELWSKKILTGKNSVEAMDLIGTNLAKKGAPYLHTAGLAAQLIGQQAAGGPAMCSSLVAVPIKHTPCLFQFSESGAPEEATRELPFVALGSGQPLADPFLAFLKRVLWEDRDPTVADGRFAASWTIRQVSRTVPGFVGGELQLATLTMKGTTPHVEFFDDAARQEHYQAVEAAEAALLDHVLGTADVEGAADLPEPPAKK